MSNVQEMTCHVMTMVLVVLVSLLGCAATESSPSEAVLRELHSKFAKYNKDLRPSIGGDPELVNVSLDVLSIQAVSAKNMEFTLEINFTQSWNDSRLSFEGSEDVSEIVLGVEKIDDIWKPDTYFVNKKAGQYQGPDNDADAFLKICQDGRILVTRRITVTADCHMYFGSYPMDSQSCSLILSSYSHTYSDIRYQWEEGNIMKRLLATVWVPEYTVYGYRQEEYLTPDYSGLSVDIQLVRQPGSIVRQHFLPAAFMVSLTCLSFLLPRAHILARLVIPLTSIITILYISTQAAQTLPPLPYWTALDVYLCFCCTTSTLALIFTALISTWERRRVYQVVKDMEGEGAGQDGEDVGEKGVRKDKDRRITGGKVDCGCLVTLPTIFLLFNIVFWSLCGGTGQLDGGDDG